MKITEHEMRGLLAGKCLPGDMRLNEDLPSYLVRKFDESQQKLDALAAENAALKKSNPNLKTVGYLAQLIGKLASMDYHPLRPVDYRISDINAWLRNYHDDKTPATDAYLNSVRAEGAIAVRNALVLADDGSDIYAIATDTAEQLRSGTHDAADKAG